MRARHRSISWTRIPTWVALSATLALGACKGSKTGELTPPSDAEPWEARYKVAYDDGYTREEVSLMGRAPNDVLDQRLFQARLGHADLVLLVEVQQVWGKGRYQGRQEQFLEIWIDRILLGDLPRKTNRRQLVEVDTPDDLPGKLQGEKMVLFLRWAPGKRPPFHHHLMPADEDLVAWMEAMVAHAREQGALRTGGQESGRARRKRERQERRAAREQKRKE